MKIWTLTDFFKLTELNANFAELYNNYLSANKTIYVSTTGSDITGKGTSANPYKTWAKGLSMIPKNQNGFDATLNVAGGTYAETVMIYGCHGGSLNILLNGDVTITSIDIQESIFVYFYAISTPYRLTTSTTSLSSITVNRGSMVAFGGLNLTLGNTSANGLNVVNGSQLSIVNGTVTINNTTTNAVTVETNSKLYVRTLVGSGNNVGIKGTNGSQISYGTKTISATTEKVLTGGAIVTNDLLMA